MFPISKITVRIALGELNADCLFPFEEDLMDFDFRPHRHVFGYLFQESVGTSYPFTTGNVELCNACTNHITVVVVGNYSAFQRSSPASM